MKGDFRSTPPIWRGLPSRSRCCRLRLVTHDYATAILRGLARDRAVGHFVRPYPEVFRASAVWAAAWSPRRRVAAIYLTSVRGTSARWITWVATEPSSKP